MTDEERKHLAEQILTNPLFEEALSYLYESAVDACITAKMDDDRGRADAAAQARAILAFRSELEAHLRDNPAPRDAPA